MERRRAVEQVPHVIGVEFGWGLLKCVEGPHFVVLGWEWSPQDSARVAAPT